MIEIGDDVAKAAVLNSPKWVSSVISLVVMIALVLLMVDVSFEAMHKNYLDNQVALAKIESEASMEIANAQLAATNLSNEKLTDLIDTVGSINTRLDVQSAALAKLTKRTVKLENAVAAIAEWSCNHEEDVTPDFCRAFLDYSADSLLGPDLIPVR